MGFLIFLLVMAVIFLPSALYERDHMSVPSGTIPDPKAKIINVEVNPVGYKSSRRIKTVVYFSDRTKFVSHKSDNTPGFACVHMRVDQEVLEEILMNAVIAHEKLLSPPGSSRSPKTPS